MPSSHTMRRARAVARSRSLAAPVVRWGEVSYCADPARKGAGHLLNIDVLGKRDLARVHLEDAFSTPHVRPVHHDLAVEAPGSEECRIEHIGTVGGRYHDDAFVGIEAVHLDQELIERLLALIVSTAEPGTAMPAHSVDLVNKNDARCVTFALLEKVAHAAVVEKDRFLTTE